MSGTVIQCVFTPFPCTTACLISCLTRITQQPPMTLSQRSELCLHIHSCVYQSVHHFVENLFGVQFEKTIEGVLTKTSISPWVQIWCLSVWGLLDIKVTWHFKYSSRWLPLYRAKEQWQCLLRNGRSYSANRLVWAQHALLHEPPSSPIRSQPFQISWCQCNALGVYMCNNGTDRQPVMSH